MIRTNYDQQVTISPCNMQFVYQGDAPGSYASYNAIPAGDIHESDPGAVMPVKPETV